MCSRVVEPNGPSTSLDLAVLRDDPPLTDLWTWSSRSDHADAGGASSEAIDRRGASGDLERRPAGPAVVFEVPEVTLVAWSDGMVFTGDTVDIAMVGMLAGRFSTEAYDDHSASSFFSTRSAVASPNP